MNILTGLTGLVIGAVAAWQVARGWAATELSHLRAYLEEQIGLLARRSRTSQDPRRPALGADGRLGRRAASRAGKMSCPWHVPSHSVLLGSATLLRRADLNGSHCSPEPHSLPVPVT